MRSRSDWCVVEASCFAVHILFEFLSSSFAQQSDAEKTIVCLKQNPPYLCFFRSNCSLFMGFYFMQCRCPKLIRYGYFSSSASRGIPAKVKLFLALPLLSSFFVEVATRIDALQHHVDAIAHLKLALAGSNLSSKIDNYVSLFGVRETRCRPNIPKKMASRL
jgi:hypothetical protein